MSSSGSVDPLPELLSALKVHINQDLLKPLRAAKCFNLLGRDESTHQAAFMHHADYLGVNLTHGVGMVHECRPGELLARAAFVHHGYKNHNTMWPLKG